MVQSRIAVVGPRPENGGVGTYVRQLASKLPEATHVTIPDTGDMGWKTVLELSRELRAYDSINIHYTYQLYGHRGALTWMLYPLLRRCRIYTTMHEVWEFETVDTPPYAVKRAYLSNLHQLLAQSSNKMVFLSKNARRAFERTTDAGSKVVIPHGVNIQDLKRYSAAKGKQMLGYEGEERIVSQIGFISRRKGIETFLEAAAESEGEFIFAGGPRNEGSVDYYRELQSKAGDNVTFTGKLSENQFHAAFDASDLVVLPYDSIRQSGILNWCVAHETPVLASDIEYFADLNEEFGYPLIKPKHEIPSSIEWAIEQPNAVADLRREHAFKSVVSEYESMIKSGKRE